MARRRYAWTEKRIAKFIKEGRGTGTGADYTPWLMVSDVPSLGRSHRIFWPVTGRQHHFLSDNEYYAFLRDCFDESTVDVREQFPLPRQNTLEIAASLGVRHPRFGGVNIVMTTDLLVTRSTSDGPKDFAYAVKPDKELRRRRVVEKLEIERVYWERQGVAWAIILESSLRKNNVITNLEWIFDSQRDPEQEFRNEPLIREQLIEGLRSLRDFPLRIVCSVVDGDLNLDDGRTLCVARQMLGQKVLRVDLNSRSVPDLPASCFSIVGVT